MINPNEDAGRLAGHLQMLYDALHLTQDTRYSNRMHQLLQQMMAYPISDRLLFASNFGATDIAICYARIYDMLYNELTADERAVAENVMMRVLRKNYSMHRGMQENHIFDNHFGNRICVSLSSVPSCCITSPHTVPKCYPC